MIQSCSFRKATSELHCIDIPENLILAMLCINEVNFAPTTAKLVSEYKAL